MDRSYTYGSPRGGIVASVYAPPKFEAPETLDLIENVSGEVVTFIRISDRPLTCGVVLGTKGSCTSAECHRRELGKCQCGRHPEGVRIVPNDPSVLPAGAVK